MLTLKKIVGFEKEDVDRLCLFLEFLVKRDAETEKRDDAFKKQGTL